MMVNRGFRETCERNPLFAEYLLSLRRKIMFQKLHLTSRQKLGLYRTLSAVICLALILGVPSAGLAAPLTNGIGQPRSINTTMPNASTVQCNNTDVWVGTLTDIDNDGSDDGVPTYFPPQNVYAVQPNEPVTVRFQMYPSSATAKVYYRISSGTTYTPNGTWTPVTATKVGTVQKNPNNSYMTATIPAVANVPARVDYYIKATLGSYSCEVGDDPYDYDDNGEHHIFSYVVTPKVTSRIYQLLVRNYGAQSANDPSYPYKAGYTKSGTFCDVTDADLNSLKELGFDTIWLSGVLDFDNNSAHKKGDAGSPYAVRNYYRASPDLACSSANAHRYNQSTYGDTQSSQATQDLISLIARIHDADMKVMIDIVPNHTSQNYTTYPSKVNAWEPDVIHPSSANYAYDYNQNNVKIIGNSNLVFPNSSNDWTDTYRLDYANALNAYGSVDPLTGQVMRAGNDTDNANPNNEISTYHMLDRVIETWQARGVDGFRIDFPHALPDDLWAYMVYNAKVRAAGFGRLGDEAGANYQNSVMIIGEGYDLDGWYGPDSGAIGNTGSNWANMYVGGFDGVYDKNGMLDQIHGMYTNGYWANGIGEMYGAEVGSTGSYTQQVGNVGITGAQSMVRMMSNHDEMQAASDNWNNTGFDNKWIVRPGAAVSALLPGSTIVYNGQEVGEAAPGIDDYNSSSPWYGQDNGKTSFFDYVFMPSLNRWKYNNSAMSNEEKALRDYYSRLYNLAGTLTSSNYPRSYGYFSLANTTEWNSQSQSARQWLYPFVRGSYIIVANFGSTSQTFTLNLHYNGTDALLSELGIQNNSNTIYQFEEVLNTKDNQGAPLTTQQIFTVSGATLHNTGLSSLSIPPYTALALRVSPITSSAYAPASVSIEMVDSDCKVSTTCTFRATVTPNSADPEGNNTYPLAYEWSADGQDTVSHEDVASLTDTVSFIWDVEGDYPISVAVSNTEGEVLATMNATATPAYPLVVTFDLQGVPVSTKVTMISDNPLLNGQKLRNENGTWTMDARVIADSNAVTTLVFYYTRKVGLRSYTETVIHTCSIPSGFHSQWDCTDGWNVPE
jgi:glycosidase